MSKLAAKPVAQKPDLARTPSWGDYDPHFAPRKAVASTYAASTAPTLNRSNSPYFPSLAGASRG